jgi:hypothetical protein
MKTLKFLILIFPLLAFGEPVAPGDLSADFSKIRGILKNDQLENELKRKVEHSKKYKELEQNKIKSKYNIPGQNELWSFLSEYWLIKSHEKLKWNFEKPDYGLDEYFANFLEEVGFYETKFKILVLDTPIVPHFSLPSNPEDNILLISLPFMRVLDLSKLEISILLLENFFRNKLDLVKKKIETPELTAQIGKNFEKKGFPRKLFEEILKKYDQAVYEKGFNFEEQFEVTRKMDNALKSNPKYWNTYLALLEKIGNLVKVNLTYRFYSKIYPSPDMQMIWLRPSKKSY